MIATKPPVAVPFSTTTTASATAAAALTFLASVLGASPVKAENWSNWRGPSFDGSSPEKNLPATFSNTDNVKWKTTLPGTGASCPVVWDNSIFLTAIDEAANGVVAIKIDRQSGEVVWKHKFADGTEQDSKSNFASPSPVTDGKRVIFFAGSTDLASYDFAGNQQWKINIEKEHGQLAFLWTFSSSPLLHQGKLYLQILQRDEPVNDRGQDDAPSYLLALDPESGKELWKVVRPAKAIKESLEAFSTPIPVTHEGRDMILIAGGDCLTAHDPDTGKELWRWGTYNPERIEHWRLVPSPVYGAGVVVLCAPKNAPVYAIKPGGNGDLGEKGIDWLNDEKGITSDVPTPLFYQGRFYVLDGNKKVISCLDPKDGKVIWSERLDAKVKLEASPTGADGKIYLISHMGEVFVLAAGDKFKVLHQTHMAGDQTTDLRTPIVPSQGNLFIRTGETLFCIGE